MQSEWMKSSFLISSFYWCFIQFCSCAGMPNLTFFFFLPFFHLLLPYLFFLFNFLLFLPAAWRCMWGRGDSSGRGSSSRYSRHTRPSWRRSYGTLRYLLLTLALIQGHYKCIWYYSLSTVHLFDCLSWYLVFRHAPCHVITCNSI